MTEVKTYITKDGGKRKLPFNETRLREAIKRDIGELDERIIEKVIRTIQQQPERSSDYIRELLQVELVAEVDVDKPEYTFKAARALLAVLYKQASRIRGIDVKDVYLDFLDYVTTATDKGIMSDEIVTKYSPAEIEEAGTFIVKERDHLFDYAGLHLLQERYLNEYKGEKVELPQERFLIIAMTLMQDEDKEDRMKYVKNAYDVMSKLQMTVATPTLANSGKPHGQLASCNIDMWDDSLDGIFTTNHSIARQSKGGAGWGLYIGKVRASGSSIKGLEGRASGPMPFTKITNAIAVAVDQLGTRNASIAVYQDVWHKDIAPFLDMKLNNGDERLRNHDLFHAVTLPDLFMEAVEERKDWYLFDPYEVEQVMGYRLEDSYDEKRGKGTFRDRYKACVENEELSKVKVKAIDIWKRIARSQLETGTPFMFYRDEVNRANPNKHEGMIYSSNLCTEIAQNMSPTIIEEEYVNEDGMIVRVSKPGDLVTCNLSSLNLGKYVNLTQEEREHLIDTQVRMLDNVVDLNEMEVHEANVTAQRYRAIGAGKFGTHHALALKGIEWETEEATKFVDAIEEEISYYTIKASVKLAKEKGAYPLFKGSDWDNGKHLADRGYFVGRSTLGADKWQSLQADINKYGIRNGYLQSPAPNGSTATIAGSTEASDPIFDVMYFEEKKNHRLPRVAPNLDHNTYNVYRRTAYKVDQRMSVAHNIARQRHIDQAISFNIYVPNDIHVGKLLDLQLQAWRGGMKTIYYVRSTATAIEGCEWCEG